MTQRNNNATSARRLRIAVVSVTLGALCALSLGALRPQEQMPVYTPEGAQRGVIRCVGSSTVGNLLNRLGQAYQPHQPGVTIEVVGSGSSSGPPAMLSGESQIMPMSRPMRASEIEAFRARYGYPPTEIIIGIDALAIFVNRSNPVESLTLEQLDAVFSIERKRGGPPVEQWSDLGVRGEIADAPLRKFGLGDHAGGYALFREMVMEGGAFRNDVSKEPGSSSIVNAVGAYKDAIGYASQFFRTNRTRIVPIVGADGVAHLPNPATCNDERYPLARSLFLYVNQPPNQPLPQPTRDFVRFVLSAQGQQVLDDGGNYKLSAERVIAERAKLR